MNTKSQKRIVAPVQGRSEGIPWSVHLQAWDAYVKKHHTLYKNILDSQSPETVADHGGFDIAELDDLIPDWRNEVSLAYQVEDLQKQVKEKDEEIFRLKKIVEMVSIELREASGVEPSSFFEKLLTDIFSEEYMLKAYIGCLKLRAQGVEMSVDLIADLIEDTLIKKRAEKLAREKVCDDN